MLSKTYPLFFVKSFNLYSDLFQFIKIITLLPPPSVLYSPVSTHSTGDDCYRGGPQTQYILIRWPCTGRGGNRDARGRLRELRLSRDSADPTRFRLPRAPPSVKEGL